jgi:hypothetical protein
MTDRMNWPEAFVVACVILGGLGCLAFVAWLRLRVRP